MNDREFIISIRDQCGAQIGTPTPSPEPTPTPTPGPTPVPTPSPTPPGVVMMTMPNAGASTFLNFEADTVYCFPVTMPTGPGSVEVGEGRGTPALPYRMALSRTIGDFDYCNTPAAGVPTGRGVTAYPCGVKGPGAKIYWTLDPNGAFDHCRVTSEQWYLMVQFDASGNQVFTYRTA